MTVKKHTARHELLGDFAPKFAELNDDVLFGEVWSSLAFYVGWSAFNIAKRSGGML